MGLIAILYVYVISVSFGTRMQNDGSPSIAVKKNFLLWDHMECREQSIRVPHEILSTIVIKKNVKIDQQVVDKQFRKMRKHAKKERSA